MKTNRINIYLFFTLLISLTACQKNEKLGEDLYELKDWKKVAEESKRHTPQTEPRSFKREVASVQDVMIIDSDKSLPEDLVTMKITEQSVAAVLRTLARVGKQNILIDDTIKSVITLNVEDVPWSSVFKGIMKTNSLNYVREGNVIRIVSSASVERELKLENLRKQLSQARKEAVKAQEMRIRTIKLHHLDIDRTAAMVSELLDIDEHKGQAISQDIDDPAVVVDHDKNTLVIKAVPGDINKILSLIEKLDRPATQVLIEARIVMTTNKAARELGVQWGGLFKHRHTWLTPGANSTGSLEGTLDDGVNPTSGFFSNFPSPSMGGGSGLLSGGSEGDILGSNGLSLGLLYADGNMVLQAQLSALEEDGKAQLLSSPSITTLDNITAYVESGTEIPYQSESQNTGTTTEFKKAVLRLEVTPHVIDGQFVKMKIFASNDEPDRDFENKDQEPAILTRKAETTVLLMDGETTVIAGLTKEQSSKFRSGVPWLKDIPYLGALFRTDYNDNEMSDMLIFITPYILGKKMVQVPLVEIEQGNDPVVDDSPVEEEAIEMDIMDK